MTLEAIKISATGEHLPADSKDHVAVLLPKHGLMFTARVINKDEKAQSDLEADCKNIDVAGFTDWRMPEIDELQLIVDRTRYNPALDPELFLDVPLDWLWSATAAAWSSASAWLVGANDGFVGNLRRSGSGFALAVRRAGQ
jgi:hypothetical protein